MKATSRILLGLVVICVALSSFTEAMALKEYINTIARREGIDPCLIKAIIKTESDGRIYAKRHEKTGYDSIGLMQVTLPAARDVGYKGSEQGLFNPYANIKYGTKYFKKMLVTFNGNICKAIAAYNAGPTNVKQGRYSPRYVAQVLGFFEMCKINGNDYLKSS